MALIRRFGYGLASLAVPFAARASADANDTKNNSPGLPMVVNTWGGPFTAATDAAYIALLDPQASALDAVQVGCAACEANQCDGTVGFGGSPDEDCETTLDALLIDGTTLNSGAVGALRRVRHAAAVARHVLDHTAHSLLVGDQATAFAAANGFAEESLATAESRAQCEAWRAGNCQPNYRVSVQPPADQACGPYTPVPPSGGGGGTVAEAGKETSSSSSHDTISLLALLGGAGKGGTDLAAGTSTNGAAHKVPGRVGDGPVAGSGAYADAEAGACGATGDGDVLMRFLPCYQAVESLRRGMRPRAAAEDALRRVKRRFPDVQAGLVVMDLLGNHAGAAVGWSFTYAYRGGGMNETRVVEVPPLEEVGGEGR
ncbi:asparaginase [Xylariomycetidae sp. FL0641]|nr:asparaginase [Xylariomycetidae sp. FL0641]